MPKVYPVVALMILTLLTLPCLVPRCGAQAAPGLDKPLPPSPSPERRGGVGQKKSSLTLPPRNGEGEGGRGSALTLPPAATRAQRYSHIRYALYFFGTAYGFLTLWGILASGLSAKMRTWAERRTRRKFGALAIYYAVLTGVLTAIYAPLTFYSGWWLAHAYGLSGQSVASWLGDVAKGKGLSYVTTVPALGLLLWLIRRSPRRWPLWFWAALVPFIAVGIFLSPLVEDPLFNKVTPLPPGSLRTRLETLAAKAGVPDAPIFVVNKSKQTRTTNAYVTGLGGSARIVLWDTTLQQFSNDETASIVAHELGHYALRHVQRGFAETVLILLLVLPVAGKFAQWLVARFGARWGLRGLDDLAAIPVLLLTFSLFSFFSAPLENGLSRQIEHEADVYGLGLDGDGLAAARVYVHFAAHDLSDPDPPPLIRFWLFSHPPLRERFDEAMAAGNPASSRQ